MKLILLVFAPALIRFNAFERRVDGVTQHSGYALDAAGSLYVTIPVTVEATLDDGKQQRFRGSYVLRRINGENMPSSDAQLWHIYSAHLERN